jgi:hypothetical protein
MNEFDHRPDSLLGDALREALSDPGDAAFARRVMERVPQTIVYESWWEVLGEWARPGVAAAVAVFAGMSIWLSQHPALDNNTPDEPIAVAESLSAGTLIASSPEFEVEMVLGEERVNE